MMEFEKVSRNNVVYMQRKDSDGNVLEEWIVADFSIPPWERSMPKAKKYKKFKTLDDKENWCFWIKDEKGVRRITEKEFLENEM